MAASRVSSTLSHARNLLNNAVHIRIHPPPNTLSESRAILRELQKFGEIAMFRNLRWDHNPNKPLDTALAIYSTHDAKSKLLSQSPVKFTPSAEEGEDHFDQLDSQNFTLFGAPPAPSPASASLPQTSAPRTFSLDIQTSSFDHEAYIKRQPYYAGFNPDMRTLVAQELRTKVPLLGLADWGRNKEAPNRIVQRRKSVGGIREMARDGVRREVGRDKKREWEDGSDADVEGSKQEVS